MGLLFSTIKHVQVPFKMLLKLFDTYVKSILNYSCETWGFSSADRCERVHRKFLKRILGVKMSTNNMALNSETGRFPLFLDRYVRIVKYWLKIAKSDYNNCIVKSVYFTLTEGLEKNENIVKWASKVKTLLQRTGFYDVWLFPDSVVLTKFVPILKMRVRDQYINEWNQKVSLSTSLQLYKEIKSTIDICSYLNKLTNIKYRKAISKIRLSSHNLNIEIGRHRQIERNNRKCPFCDLNELEDEYHFILICPQYCDIKIRYIKKYYYTRPTMLKLYSRPKVTLHFSFLNISILVLILSRLNIVISFQHFSTHNSWKTTYAR